MSHNFSTGEEQEKFQNRWAYRMKDNDLDSLSNDSNSSHSSPEPPSLIKTPARKPQNKRRATAKRASNANNNASSEKVPLNELKNYMSSLLDEMKETRDGMLKCLKEQVKKMVAEEVASQLERRQQCSCSHQLPQKQETMSKEVGTAERISKHKRPSSDACNSSNPEAENRNDYSMAIVAVTDDSVLEEKQKPEIVLGIKAHHDSATQSSVPRSKRGRRAAESSIQLGQSTEVKAGGRMGLFEPGFTSTSPKYLTLPTRQLDSPSMFSNIQARVDGSGSSYMGYFQRLLHSGESSSSSSRSFAPMNSSMEGSYLRENYRMVNPGVGRGFQVGVQHQNVDGYNNLRIPSQQVGSMEGRQSRHFPAGLRMTAGGIRFSDGRS